LDVTRAVAQKYGILVLGSIFPFSTAKVTGRSQARAHDPPLVAQPVLRLGWPSGTTTMVVEQRSGQCDMTVGASSYHQATVATMPS
jgi:hypothetical protein